MGHFDERPPPNGVAPMAGWANFTSQCTVSQACFVFIVECQHAAVLTLLRCGLQVRYDPAYGKFGLEYPCVAQPWDRTSTPATTPTLLHHALNC